MGFDLSRRRLLGSAAAVGLGAVGGSIGLAGCGSSNTEVRGNAPRRTPDSAPTNEVVQAIARGGGAVLGRAMAQRANDNIWVSPWSLYAALAMVRLGARTQTATAIDRVLGVDGTQVLPAGINTLGQTLAQRAGERTNNHGKKGTVELADANSVWVQSGLAWQPAFLDGLTAWFGAGLHQTDYRAQPEAASRAINQWVADRTNKRITDLLGPGDVHTLTRLAVANALYLKAPWMRPFEQAATTRRPFATATGTRVDVLMMQEEVSAVQDPAGRWDGAELPLIGNELAMRIVLPRPGAERAVRALMTGPELATVMAEPARESTFLIVPKFRLRSRLPLADILRDLGMEIAFSNQADFSGMTDQERLKLDAVQQQVFVTIDEDGLEAAAATVATARLVSGSPKELKVDRPFYALVFDRATRVPLFVGYVADPSRAAE